MQLGSMTFGLVVVTVAGMSLGVQAAPVSVYHTGGTPTVQDWYQSFGHLTSYAPTGSALPGR